MEEYGFDVGISCDVVLQILLDIEVYCGCGLMLGLLFKKLLIVLVDLFDVGGVIVLVGLIGVGKIIIIVKLVLCFVEKYVVCDVVLVIIDIGCIGVCEQFYGFGCQFGIVVYEVNSGIDLSQLLECLQDYKLVLIDIVGFGLCDCVFVVQLQWLWVVDCICILLVLLVNISFGDMDEVVCCFSVVNLQGVVLSKLDEIGCFGIVLFVVVDYCLLIIWVIDGQDVLEDLYCVSVVNFVFCFEDLCCVVDMFCNLEFNYVVV